MRFYKYRRRFCKSNSFKIYDFLIDKNKKEKYKRKLKKIYKEFLKAIGTILLNLLTAGYLGLSYSLPDNIVKDINEINDEINKKTKQQTKHKTIVIFDNLERLEKDFLFTFKLIQKISKIDNLLIILPMDVNKIHIDGISNINEWLEKYITLGNYFLLNQNYEDFSKIN